MVNIEYQVAISNSVHHTHTYIFIYLFIYIYINTIIEPVSLYMYSLYISTMKECVLY